VRGELLGVVEERQRSEVDRLTPYCDRSTRLLVITNDGTSRYSTCATSGVPVPAFRASVSLVYSSPAAPAFSIVTQMPGWVWLNFLTARS